MRLGEPGSATYPLQSERVPFALPCPAVYLSSPLRFERVVVVVAVA